MRNHEELIRKAHARSNDPAPNLFAWAAVNYLNETAPHSSAKVRFVRGQWRVLAIIVAMLATGFAFAPGSTIIVLNALFIFHCLTVLLLRAFLLYLSATGATEPSKKPKPLDIADLPSITILCPVYKEVDGFPGLATALANLNYPPHLLDIKILLEFDDLETIHRAETLNLPAHFQLVIIPESEPRTKPKACNYALWQSRGELIVIYDAEDRPSPNQLLEAAAAFSISPDEVCCLQARLNYYNRERSALTRLFAIEYALLFDLILPGLDQITAPLPLGGTSNFFRTRQLIEIGGWDPFNVTEDADLGMRMAAHGFKSKMINSTTYEEATSEIRPWIRQRSRWIKGYMQTWVVHSRKHSHPRGIQFYLTLHLLIGSVVFSAILNPIYWGLYAIWLSGAQWANPLFPAPLDAVATFTLLAGNFFHIWLFMLAPMRRQWHDLVPYALLAPIYWLLQSAAGYIALWQFFTQPFYWEKTVHGEGSDLDFKNLESASDPP